MQKTADLFAFTKKILNGIFFVRCTTLKPSAKHHPKQKVFIKHIGRSLNFFNDSVLVNLHSFNIFFWSPTTL